MIVSTTPFDDLALLRASLTVFTFPLMKQLDSG